MSDNVRVNPGEKATAITVATDEVDDVHFPIYKQGFGLEGVEPTQVSADNPIPVSLYKGGESVTTDLFAYQVATIELLEEIAEKLQILILHQEDATDETYDAEDISNGDNR